MLISANELAALLKRVFEGLGYPQGQYEDAAAMAGWLPLHGEDGLDALAWQADPALPATELSAPAPAAWSHDAMVAARWTPCRPCWTWPACARPGKAGSSWKSWTAAIANASSSCWRIAPARAAGPGAMGRRRCASASPHRLDRKRRRLSELPDGGPAGTRRCGIATLPDADAGYRAPACSALEAGAARITRRVTPADYAQAGARAGTRHGRVADAVATPEPARRSGLGGELGTVAQRRGRSMSL